MNMNKYIIIIFIVILLLPRISRATIIVAQSCSRADVQSAISNATYGDTVKIPAGDCTWSTGNIEITKDIKIVGSGINETILRMNFTNDNNYEAFFKFMPDSTSISRLDSIVDEGIIDVSKIRFVGSSRMPYKFAIWVYNYSTLIKRVRIHDCKFEDIHRAVQTDGNIYGCFDSNILINTNAAYPSADNDNSWNNYPATLGSGDGWYIEDNTFTFSGGVGTISGGGHGMSHVVRYNTVSGSHAIYVESHGNQTNGIKGTQITEIYGNDFSSTANQGIDMRGGKCIVFYNKINDDSLQVREEFNDHASGTLLTNACIEDGGCPSSGTFQSCDDDCVCMKVNHSYFFNNRRLSGDILNAQITYDRCDNVTTNDPPELVENREFYNYNSSFDGTTGIGCGTLANRPDT